MGVEKQNAIFKRESKCNRNDSYKSIYLMFFIVRWHMDPIFLGVKQVTVTMVTTTTSNLKISQEVFVAVYAPLLLMKPLLSGVL